jgi:hypothetical protein
MPQEPSSALGLALPSSFSSLVKTFASYTDYGNDFFIQIGTYFKPVHVSGGEVLWNAGEVADGLYLIKTGCLRATYQVSLLSRCAKDTRQAADPALFFFSSTLSIREP